MNTLRRSPEVQKFHECRTWLMFMATMPLWMTGYIHIAFFLISR
jgi:hypothetical protein